MTKIHHVVGVLLVNFSLAAACIINGIDQNNLRTTGQHAENVPKLLQASEDNYKPEPQEPSPN